MGDEPSVGLARTLEGLDFRLGRMKTGTPPRLAKDTIDFSQTEVNRGDEVPVPFSFLNQKVTIDPTDQVWPHNLICFLDDYLQRQVTVPGPKRQTSDRNVKTG